MRLVRLLILSLLLGAACAAQDTAVLEGEPAIRFLVGHGHATNYCEGQLWVTATRVRFDSVTLPAHSFDHKRADVKDVHAASAWGFHYVKIEAGGHTYRMAIYPDLAHAFGDRLEFVASAWKDFPSAYAKVQQVEAGRAPDPAVKVEGEALEFPVLAVLQVAWFKGPKGVTAWSGPEAGADAYGKIQGMYVAGTLRVTADRVQFHRATDGVVGEIDSTRDQMRVNSAIGGYPRIILNFRSAGRVSFVLGTADEKGHLQLHDASPLVRAVGPEFPQVVEEVRKASVK